MRITVLDGYGLNPGDLSWEPIAQLGELTVFPRTSAEEFYAHAEGADILLTNKTLITAEHIDRLPDLKYIGILATGYNVVDIEAARKHGIPVCNIPAYSTRSVAQMVFALLLAITNRVEHYAEENRKGRWSRNPDFCYWDTPLMELSGKKMGIVGLGHTGMATARIALAFGMEVYACTSKSPLQLGTDIRKSTMEELFSACDVISLNCPLTPETHHLVNPHTLALMKPGAILINTGRGPLVDEEAVAEALRNNILAAYGADVTSTEPPSADHPLLSAPCDYVFTHFTLKSPQLPGGEVYLNGEWTYNRFIPEYRMTYNRETQAYEATALLKQGYYNYNYLFVPDGETQGNSGRTDGNFYETENEYIILVYDRPNGGRYDKLVGYRRMNFKINGK